MLELAATRFVNRYNTTTTKNLNNVLTNSSAIDAPEIWNPHWMGTINDYTRYKLEDLLLNFWQIYLEEVDEVNLVIEAGGRLFISSVDIIGSSFRKRDDTRRDDFMFK
ncbi:hypothetical protein INT45_011557 [Circinella minor]|uniref:Uncharacterized protein n=1 Tax=Circinella minor TaxID=1195481 RepID=A0A8H7S5T7_9FUNG|nr:hypothetical protein INT45_011557 [Circinella minor]